MSSPLVGVAAINSLLFGVYGWFMNIQLKGLANEPTLTQVAIAGCGSGIVNSLFR